MTGRADGLNDIFDHNVKVRKNLNTDGGTIQKTPTSDEDITNKKYVDDKEVESFPTSLTAGSVVFSDGTNLSQDNFNLFWDNAINQLEPNLIKITSDGTQASPALKFNDTNTGFYKSGDSVRLSINNSTKLTVLGDGKVGIGLPNPDGMLEILNPNESQGLKIQNVTETDIVFSALKTDDTFVRFAISGTGVTTWGAGALAADVNLYRGAANILQTDDTFSLRDTLTIGSATQAKIILNYDAGDDFQVYNNFGNFLIRNLTDSRTDLQIDGAGNFTIGGATNNIEISTGGNLVFVGGAGLAFAEIYARDNTATTSTSTTKAQVLIFDTDGEFNNMTPDHAQDHIIVTKAGKYKIDASISIKNSSGAAHVISLEMYKNNGTGVYNNIHAGRTLGTGTDVGNLTMSGIVDLAVNDTIEIWITSDSGAARTVTVEDIDLCAIQIGGT